MCPASTFASAPPSNKICTNAARVTVAGMGRESFFDTKGRQTEQLAEMTSDPRTCLYR